MAAKIVGVIPPQAYELIRNKIVEILGEELSNQFIMTGEYEADVDVWMERVVTLDVSEMNPCLVNVSFLDGDYENEDPRTADGVYSYAVDIYGKAASSETEDGDITSTLRVQRLLGICRAILMATQYKHLGFVNLQNNPAGTFIKNRRISKIQMFDPNKLKGAAMNSDTDFITGGRLILAVKVPEDVETVIPNLEKGSDAMVNIGLTTKGYKWTRNNPPLTS